MPEKPTNIVMNPMIIFTQTKKLDAAVLIFSFLEKIANGNIFINILAHSDRLPVYVNENGYFLSLKGYIRGRSVQLQVTD